MSSASAWLLIGVLSAAGGLGLKGKAGDGTASQKGSGEARPKMGSLDKEQIQAVIQEHRKDIAQCYESALANSPTLAGKITVKFTISLEGKVQAVSVAESTMKAPAVEQCVTEQVATWTFPKPKGNGIVVVAYPFAFKTTPDDSKHGD